MIIKKKIAEKVLKDVNERLSGKVVTKISLLKNYCQAEEYHQKYLAKKIMSLVETNWLEKNLDNVKIIDCSWHMPQTERNGFDEYNKEHIPNAIFFDLDKNSNQNTDLPHMLTDIRSWEKIISEMGIENNDRIVVYDNSDVISSCRCWYNFIYFGHDPNLVHVLNGGLKKWKEEKKIVNDKIVTTNNSKYLCTENKELVKNKKQINENIKLKEFNVIDARSKERFKGKVAEPRKGFRSGSIKNSFLFALF